MVGSRFLLVVLYFRWSTLIYSIFFSKKTAYEKKNCQLFLLASQYFSLAQKPYFSKSRFKKQKTANQRQPRPTLAIAYPRLECKRGRGVSQQEGLHCFQFSLIQGRRAFGENSPLIFSICHFSLKG